METETSARCLIVEDESPARDELRFLIDRIDGVVVVGDATTAEEARVLLESVDYDLVLLDIHMPGIGGIELARTLRAQPRRPSVIFVTADPDHAVEAFDLEASDYLVKPIAEDRLRRAIQRALEARGVPGNGGEPVAARSDRRTVPARIPVHRGDRVILVEEQQIAFAEAARGYAHLKLADERLLASFTLNDLEQRLSSAFVRTHRSYLVNLRHVREVVQEVGGTLTLVMADRDRSRVPVARRQAAEVRRQLGM